MRLKDRTAREKAWVGIEKDLKELKATLANGEELAKAFTGLNSTPELRGKVLGDTLICLLIPAVNKVQQAADRQEQTQRNLHVAFALAAYQREQGSYPKKLEELAPKYLANVPDDLFSGKALIYQPNAKGYLLYSVGVNGVDDQGRSYDDDPSGDDLPVCGCRCRSANRDNGTVRETMNQNGKRTEKDETTCDLRLLRC